MVHHLRAITLSFSEPNIKVTKSYLLHYYSNKKLYKGFDT